MLSNGKNGVGQVKTKVIDPKTTMDDAPAGGGTNAKPLYGYGILL